MASLSTSSLHFVLVALGQRPVHVSKCPLVHTSSGAWDLGAGYYVPRGDVRKRIEISEAGNLPYTVETQAAA